MSYTSDMTRDQLLEIMPNAEDRIAVFLDPLNAAMAEFEKGAIANPDENRMVGHYWLRAPELAPSPAIATEIRDNVARIKQFAEQRLEAML